MENDFSEMVKSVMSDPESFSKLMGMAQGLMGSSPSSNGKESEEPQRVSTVGAEKETHTDGNTLLSHLKNGNEERIALISALRPYLSEERRKNADNLIKMLKMMKLADINKLFQNT